MQRRPILKIAAAVVMLGALGAFSGCSSMRTLSSEVATYGEWPAGRAAGTYAFERLPSQQAHAAESEALETSARAALAKAGFTPVEAGKEPDVLVQLGARDSGVELPLWDDPLWWRGGFGSWRYGPWLTPRWGVGLRAGYGSFGPYGRYDRYERQVALLIRDRLSGKPLFEARAMSEGSAPSQPAVLAAMFEAALKDFPKLGANPRTVDVLMAN